MEFRNEFTVPVDVDRAFEVLTDLERVAPCLPGASLEEVDGDTFTGTVKVKVGPITVTYRGTAELTERDVAGRRAAIRARGRESRGSGTATAEVTAQLEPAGAQATDVVVTTDLAITGKPAQFGRGVMADVGTKLIDTFAQRLAAMIGEDLDGADAEVEPVGTPAPQQAQPLDLVDLAGGAVTKRLVPVAAGAAVLAVIVWWWRRR